jgi:streptomycin 6-kinase
LRAASRREARLAAWRAELDQRAAGIAAAWGLTLGATLADGPTSRLIAVRDQPLALKLAPPGQGIEAEIAALRALAGRGAVTLHRADATEGALLLARLSPGTRLLDLAYRDDDAATRIAARLIATLPCTPPPGAIFAEAAGWGRALAAGAGRLDPELIDRAACELRDLIASAPAPLLLHGDLHHTNILRDGDGWVAVDPKGLLGERAAEAACLLRNPADSALLARARHRAAIVAEAANLDRARLLAWGHVGAVIAACWAIEDGTDPTPWLAAAAALR